MPQNWERNAPAPLRKPYMKLNRMIATMEAAPEAARGATPILPTMAVSTMPMAQPSRFCRAMGRVIAMILRA